MFRKGGSAGQGIMSKVEPRQGYQAGKSVKELYDEYRPLYEAATKPMRDDSISKFLIRGGMNLIDRSDKDTGFLQSLTGAYREPTEKLISDTERADAFARQGQLAALGSAIKSKQIQDTALSKKTRPLKAQTIEGQVENFYAIRGKNASDSTMAELYALRPQIKKAFQMNVAPRIAPTNMKGTEIDRSFYVGKPNGTLYINPIRGLFEMVIDEKPFRRIDQDTLQPITKAR